MQRVIFPNGYEVVTDDLSGMQEFLADQIKERSSIEVFNPGISGIFKAYVVAGSLTKTIKVLALNAYNSLGEKIEIASDVDNLAPSTVDFTTLVNAAGAWTSSIRYIIVARYIELDDTAVIHPITGATAYSRKTPSYTLHALRRSGSTVDNFVAGDVRLARIDVDNSGAIMITVNSPDLDEGFEVTQYYRLDTKKLSGYIGSTTPAYYDTLREITLQDHIDSRGSGIITPLNPHALSLAELTGTIDGSRITDGTVTSSKIYTAAITKSLLAANSVDTAQLEDQSVTTDKIEDHSVTNVKLASDAIRSSSYSFTIQGDAAVITKLIQRLVDRSITFEKVIIYADTAPTVTPLIIDININGTSIYAAHPLFRPTIAVGTNGPHEFTLFDTATAAAGDRISIDIDQIGTVPGGNDLMITIVYR